jgi:hypothetical protein
LSAMGLQNRKARGPKVIGASLQQNTRSEKTRGPKVLAKHGSKTRGPKKHAVRRSWQNTRSEGHWGKTRGPKVIGASLQ